MVDQESRLRGWKAAGNGDPLEYLRSGNEFARAGRMEEAIEAYREASRRSETPEQRREIAQEANRTIRPFNKSEAAYRLILPASADIPGIFQPLPDQLRYETGPFSDTYAEEARRVRNIEMPYQPVALIIDKQTGKQKPVKRMFTFEENMQARVQDFNTRVDDQGNPRTMKQRLALFAEWLSSLTGVIYKGGSTKAKIDQMSKTLLGIPEDFNKPFIEIPYESADGIEFDIAEDIYSSLEEGYRPFTNVGQVVNHKGWRAAVTKDILEPYAKIYFSRRKAGMAFWVIKNPKQDQLRALELSSLHRDSDASADWSLGIYAQSLQVAQK